MFLHFPEPFPHLFAHISGSIKHESDPVSVESSPENAEGLVQQQQFAPRPKLSWPGADGKGGGGRGGGGGLLPGMSPAVTAGGLGKRTAASGRKGWYGNGILHADWSVEWIAILIGYITLDLQPGQLMVRC